MEVLKITVDLDSIGELNTNLPTNLEAGMDVVVIINSSLEHKKVRGNYNFSVLAGKISWCDAVATQRSLRDE